MIDLDEFVYTRSEEQTLSQYLASVEPDCGVVVVPWTSFAAETTGRHPKSLIQTNVYRRAQQAGRTCVKSITRRSHLCHATSFDVHRGIVRSRQCRSAAARGRAAVDRAGTYLYDQEQLTCEEFRTGVDNPHWSGADADCYHRFEEPNPANGTCMQPRYVRWFQMSQQASLLPDPAEALRLNHYKTQSWEFFCKVKMTRGDALNAAVDEGRDVRYFLSYQEQILANQTLDDELARRRGSRFFARLPPRAMRAWPRRRPPRRAWPPRFPLAPWRHCEHAAPPPELVPASTECIAGRLRPDGGVCRGNST